MQKEFNLDNTKLLWVQNILRSNLPKSENLVDHLGGSKDFNLLILTAKGIQTLNSFRNNEREKFPGVFIAARNIVNNGEITAEGPGYKTEIITENYEGKGTVSAKDRQKEFFLSKFFWQFIIVIAAGLIIAYLVFVFGWNK